MNGWNLPPGCTDRDIDIAQGAIAFCEQCGRDVEDPPVEGEVLCAQCTLGDAPYDRSREES